MGKKPIGSIAELQLACEAQTRKLQKQYRRPYVLAPALARNLERFSELNGIGDEASRFEAFRRIPALEFDLEAIWSGFTPHQRRSLAQQDRARHSRVRLTEHGHRIATIIVDLIREDSSARTRKAKEYWLLLECRLRDLTLDPRLEVAASDPTRQYLSYRYGQKRRRLSLGQFLNLVSAIRKARSR